MIVRAVRKHADGDGRTIGSFALERARQRAESEIRPLFRLLCPQPNIDATPIVQGRDVVQLTAH